MRSRFTAFALGNWPYLWRTLHPDHVDRRGAYEDWARAAVAGARGATFRSLRILDVGPQGQDSFAHVLFAAEVSMGRQDASFIEHSRFSRDGEGWRYLDGITLNRSQVKVPLRALDFASFDELV